MPLTNKEIALKLLRDHKTSLEQLHKFEKFLCEQTIQNVAILEFLSLIKEEKKVKKKLK
jgi:hypothetical protein